nr:hypothetical protein [Noviherbaspirillum pedocola]
MSHRHSHLVDDSAAALDRAKSGAAAIGDLVADQRTGHGTNRSRNSTSVSAANLVAQDATGKSTENYATIALTGVLYRDLLVPALLARALEDAIFRRRGHKRKGENRDYAQCPE